MFFVYDSNITFKENAEGDKKKIKSIDLTEIGLYQLEGSDTIVY